MSAALRRLPFSGILLVLAVTVVAIAVAIFAAAWSPSEITWSYVTPAYS